LRAAAKGEGRPLTQVNALALAGKWYSWFLAQHENDIRSPSHWADLRDYFIWDVIGREAPDEYKADTDADPHWEWAKAPEVRDAVRATKGSLGNIRLRGVRGSSCLWLQIGAFVRLGHLDFKVRA
jgi:hypothetical protein